jgi:hypothetical protein
MSKRRGLVNVLFWSLNGGAGVTVTTALVARAVARAQQSVVACGGHDLAAVLGLGVPAKSLGETRVLEQLHFSWLENRQDRKESHVVDGSSLTRDEREVMGATSHSILVLPLALTSVMRAHRATPDVDAIVAIDLGLDVVDVRDVEDVLAVPVVDVVPRTLAIGRAAETGRLAQVERRRHGLVEGVRRHISEVLAA